MTKLVFGSPMFVHLNNPLSKLFYRRCAFHVVTDSATWNTVIFNITNFIINSIYSIENIFTIKMFWVVDLIRRYSAIMARFLGNLSKEFHAETPFKFSIFSIVFSFSVKLSKGCFSFIQSTIRNWLLASTTFRKAASKSVSYYYSFRSTVTSTKPSSVMKLIAPRSTKNCPISKSFSYHVDYCFFSHCFTLKNYLREVSVLMSRQYPNSRRLFEIISPMGNYCLDTAIIP